MNRIVLISSYCNTQEKLDVLENCLDTIKKELGYDTMVTSPISIPSKYIEKASYYFQTKDNPTLNWPEKAIHIWREFPLKDLQGNIIKGVMTSAMPDQGLANAIQVKKLSQIALTFDYDHFYHILYDLKLNDVALKTLRDNKPCAINAARRLKTDSHWRASLHCSSFDRKNLEILEKVIGRQSYVKGRPPMYHGNIYPYIEEWISTIADILGFELIPDEVDDLIFEQDTDKYHYFGVSISDDFRLFIIKDITMDGVLQDLQKCFFFIYEAKKSVKFTLIENSIEREVSANNFDIIESNIFCNEKDPTLKIKYKNNVVDLTTYLKNITKNTLRNLSHPAS